MEKNIYKIVKSPSGVFLKEYSHACKEIQLVYLKFSARV